MDPEAGEWVSTPDGVPTDLIATDMDTYEVGEVIQVKGDFFQVVEINSTDEGKARLVLEIMDAEDRKVLRRELTGQVLKGEAENIKSPINRHDRRARDRRLRRLLNAVGRVGK